MPIQFPGNHGNSTGIGFFDSPVKLLWEDSQNQFVGACGNISGRIQDDEGETWIERSFSCGATGGGDVYELHVTVCDGVSGCQQNTSVMVDVTDGALQTVACPVPPEEDCDDNCLVCRTTRGGGDGEGGASAAGGGGHGGGAGTGPGALFRYKAGSVGAPRLPGSPNLGLGRFWSHSYAGRLFEDDNPSPHAARVHFVTESAVYRTYVDDDGDGLYEIITPADDYRRLETAPGGGWTLTSLDGTVESFDAMGFWLGRVDKNGNATTATYDGDFLMSVSFPDGRREDFGYLGGKLKTITEVGVDGLTSLVWTYTWTGQDLTRIDRPDGTALEYLYNDPNHGGYMTRTTLIGSDGVSERITAAWAYDAEGNVIRLWRGAEDFSDGVDRWAFDFDNPVLPTVTTITDPLGDVSTTAFAARDASARKARAAVIDGDCPVCGVGPNSQLAYEDPDHPYRVTAEIDGRGHVTRFEYDANGRRTRRIDAFGTALERETVWTYDPIFPAFVTSTEQTSTSGFPNLKTTTNVYDASGDRAHRTLEGFEAGVAFSYTTDFVYNDGGQVTSIDPPGYSTEDQTTFTYDPTRGNGFLVPATRTDPLIGVTAFGHDAFNRRTSVTDPNGVVTETEIDALDRVRFIIQRGATPSEDLVTEHRYNIFGDLFQTVLPEGNVIEYGYDPAGRLTSIERKADDQPTSHSERVVYTPDDAGNRILEEHERWTGSAWEKRSQTAYQYTNRCQLQLLTQGFGGEEVATEYAYDCAGNLERVWDANHPSAGQVNPASSEYIYDELDRLSEVHQPWGGAGGGEVVVGYGYDVQDHLTQVTDGEGGVTTYTYSDRDLLTDEVSEVSGTTTHTYNEHGEADSRTDARGVVMVRTPDALDRVRLEDYPDDTLDVTYTYDDPSVAFSLGRLTKVERDSHAIDTTYDRFGRVLQDGDLVYAYDKNGNRTAVVYPGSVSAIYTYDEVDRQSTLTIQRPGEPDLGLVSIASYEPAGPLASLTLGNGVSETRSYDTRYYPAAIQAISGSSLLDWQYTPDAIGNITAIVDALTPANDRTYAYQDFQDYLTQGDGPWGDLAWTYDEIGNRLSETRDGVVDTYTYVPNIALGHSAKLDQIQMGVGGTRTYTYDAAGNETQVDTVGDVVDRTYDDASRMAHQERATAGASSDFLYDGRGFLRLSSGVAPDSDSGIFCDGFESGDTSGWGGAGACPSTVSLRTSEPTYSLAGLLHGVTSPGDRRFYFYFAGRPVAQSATSGGLLYLSTDHLGTPILATDEAGSVAWKGGFEPFGTDYSGASTAGVALRFPGQWVDRSWAESSNGASVANNLHRWFAAGAGRYSQPDPLGLRGDPHLYIYGFGNPISLLDPLGLYTIDGSCKCPAADPTGKPGSGLPTDRLSVEVDTICSQLEQQITDPKLRRCIKKSCDRGKISCVDGCDEGDNSGAGRMLAFNDRRFIGSLQLVNRKAKLCRNTIPFDAQPGAFGEIVIHEWAHGCKWQHMDKSGTDGEGVPGANGEFDPN